MAENKPELTFKYIFSYNYNPAYVNGAQGGISPRGEVVIHFYLERPALPNALTHQINPNGSIGPEIAVEPADLPSSMVRFIDTGVVMNLANARMFHAWLGDRIKEAENMEKARSPFVGQSEGSGLSH